MKKLLLPSFILLLLSLIVLSTTGIQIESLRKQYNLIKDYPKDWYATRKLNEEKNKIKEKIDKYTTDYPKIRAKAYKIVDKTLTLKELKTAQYNSQVLQDRAISKAFKLFAQEIAKFAAKEAAIEALHRYNRHSNF